MVDQRRLETRVIKGRKNLISNFLPVPNDRYGERESVDEI